jgi:hypothetical protein
MSEPNDRAVEITLDVAIDRVAAEALRLDVLELARRHGVVLKDFRTEPVPQE